MLLPLTPVILAFLPLLWATLAVGADAANTNRIADYVASGIEEEQAFSANLTVRESLSDSLTITHLSPSSRKVQE